MDASPQESVEQHDMQHVVQSVAAGKADETFPGGCPTEREIACQEEVAYKTHHISSGIGDVDIYPPLQQIVDAVVYGSRQCTDYAETQKLYQPLVMAETFCDLFD